MDRFSKIATWTAWTAVLTLVGSLHAMPASPAPDDRDHAIREALHGATPATAAPVEEAAKKTLAAQPKDAVAQAIVAGTTLLRAEHAFPARPDGTVPPAGWDGKLALDAFQKAWAVRQTAPGLPTLNGVYLKASAVCVQSEAIKEAFAKWPDAYFDAGAQAALGAGLATLAPREDGDTALELADAWAKRFPDDPEVRRQLIGLWWNGGALDRAIASIDRWSKTAPAGQWKLQRAELALVRDGLEEGRKKLEGVTDAGAASLATLIAGALGEAEARAGLEALAAKGDPARPGAKLVAAALLKLGGDAKAAGAALEEAGNTLAVERAYVESAVALYARQRLGSWDDAEVYALADLWRKMREWEREIAVIAPLAERADKDGKLHNDVNAGDFHFRVGRAAFHARRFEQSHREYDLAAKTGKDDPELYFHIAKLLFLEKRKVEALVWLKKAADWKDPAQHADKARTELFKVGVPGYSPAPPAPPSWTEH